MIRPRAGGTWRAGGVRRIVGALRTGSLVAAAIGVALVASGLSRRRRPGAEAGPVPGRPGASPLLHRAPTDPVAVAPAGGGLPPREVVPDAADERASAPPGSLGADRHTDDHAAGDAAVRGDGGGDGEADAQSDRTRKELADAAAVAHVGTRADGPDGPAPARAPARRSPPWPAVAAGVLVLAAAVIGAVVADDRSGGPSAATSGTAAGPERSTTTAPVAAVTPRQAVELAGRRLAAAGSFTYRGTMSATDVSAVRPGLWLAVDTTIEGEVDLSSGRLHEVAVADDGRATETIVDGPTVWGRSAPSREELAAEPYQVVSSDGDPGASRGVALLARWFSATTDHHDVEDPPNGRRRVAATVPAEILGEVERGRVPVAGRIVLTLAPTGDPVAVEVTTVPEGPPLRLTIALSALGEPVAIEPPAV